jgi:hypothetical protein
MDMAVLDDIRAAVNEIANQRGLDESRAFAFWFLTEFEELSPEDAENTITDGPWDRGCDAVYPDEEEGIYNIWQFKFSEDENYVKGALRDFQTAVRSKAGEFRNFRRLKLTLVSLVSPSLEFEEEIKRVKGEIKRWLTRQNFEISLEVETVGVKWFLERMQKIYGVDLDLDWNGSIYIANCILGLVNASQIARYVTREELFAFNIRKFLGLRKGGVSSKIKETLEKDDRAEFWKHNNGIVCVCTDFQPLTENKVHFKNFTIVNGAQTIHTIAKFLEENPVITEPIWTVAKVEKIEEHEIEKATLRTITSNTQTPTSNKDLRAVDSWHKWIEDWLQRYFNLAYIYKRGQKSRQEKVGMKDMAQAYVAFEKEEPHISFARPGQIFAKDEYYNFVFPEEELRELKQRGNENEIRKFLLDRLIPCKLLCGIREYLRGAATGDNRKYRSLAYHILWVYRNPIKSKVEREGSDSVYEKLTEILNNTKEDLYQRIYEFVRAAELDIPRDLKSGKLRDKLAKEMNELPWYNTLIKKIESA